jgi:WD40 repeat protein
MQADHPLLGVTSQDGSVRLANVATGKILKSFFHPGAGADEEVVEEKTTKETVSARGGAGGGGAGGGGGGEEEGEGEDRDYSTPATTSVESAAFSTSNPWLASGATDGSVRIWDMNSGHARSSLDADGGVIKVDWVAGMPHLLCASTINGAVHIWDSRNGALVQSLTGHTGMILDFAASTGREGEIVTCGDDSTVRVYNIGQGRGGTSATSVIGAGGME